MKAALVLALLAAPVALAAVPARSHADDCGISFRNRSVRWADYHDAGDARIAITTENGKVTLLLTDRVVALQLSEAVFDRVERKMRRERDRQDNPFAAAMVTAVLGTVQEVLDHSLECRVRDLRDAAYEDGRLLLITRSGDVLFADNDMDDDDLLSAFSPADARRFVREFRRLKAERR